MFGSAAATAGVTTFLFIAWVIAMKHPFQRSRKCEVNMRRAVRSLNCTRVAPPLANAAARLRLWSGWPTTSG
jgi:hypothetical protein